MTISPELVRDLKGEKIQGCLHPSISHHLPLVSGESKMNSIDFAYDIVEVYSTTDTFFDFGDTSVYALSGEFFLPAETTRYYSLKGDTRIAARSGATGTLYIAEME